MMLKMKRVAACAALIAALGAAADDADPMAACDSAYATCNGRCDAMENASSECYGACDDTYQNCLDVANGYPPEPAKTADEPKPAAKLAKAVKKNAPALESQDKGADPNRAGHEQ